MFPRVWGSQDKRHVYVGITGISDFRAEDPGLRRLKLRRFVTTASHDNHHIPARR
jgi:hypothetical protein